VTATVTRDCDVTWRDVAWRGCDCGCDCASLGGRALTDCRGASQMMQTYEVVVPEGVRPGRPFALMAGGQRLMVTCPAHARVGGWVGPVVSHVFCYKFLPADLSTASWCDCLLETRR
jgi:hypothetical protein